MSISERRNNDSGHFQQNGRENNLILRECSNYMENTLQNRERDSMKARDWNVIPRKAFSILWIL